MCISTSRSSSPLARFRRPPALSADLSEGPRCDRPGVLHRGQRWALPALEARAAAGLAEPHLHQPALRRRAAGDRHSHAPVDHQGRLGVAADREPGDGPLPVALLPLLLRRLLRRRLLRHRLRRLPHAPPGPAPGSATSRCSRPVAASRVPEARCPSSTTAGCASPMPRGTSATPATRSRPACRRKPGGCPQRKLHVATLGSTRDGTLRVAARGWARLAVIAVPLAALLLSGTVAASGSGARPAPVGSDPFRAGTAYSGDFPDPTIMRVGKTFYAYSTTVARTEPPGDDVGRPAPLDAASVVRLEQAVPERRPAHRPPLGADQDDAERQGVLADLGAVGRTGWVRDASWRRTPFHAGATVGTASRSPGAACRWARSSTTPSVR